MAPKVRKYLYNCEKCNFHTDRSNDYKVHVKSKKHMNNYNICEICFKQFKFASILKTHIKRLTPCKPPNDIINPNEQIVPSIVTRLMSEDAAIVANALEELKIKDIPIIQIPKKE